MEMSVPGLMHTRLVPIRPLSPEECERLDYIGPLVLARHEHRFMVGPWRKAKLVLVTTPFSGDGTAEVLMTCTPAQLRERGVEPS